MNEFSYDKSRSVVLAIDSTSLNSEEVVSKLIEDGERRSAAVAQKGMPMAVSHIISTTSRSSRANIDQLDDKLRSTGAATPTEIQASSNGYFTEIPKRAKIGSVEEFDNIRVTLDCGVIKDHKLPISSETIVLTLA